MNKPTITIYNDDCRNFLRDMPDNSVDSIITDPPYELGFMGKDWDRSGIAYDVNMWHDALRVLKPGGHLLAFSGSRTYHRMTCAIEDAGFEVRDQIMWLYGSGFPKSLDVSKAVEAHILTGKSDSKQTGDGNARDRTGQHWSEFPATKRDKAAFNPTTEAARQWQGWGTALKPAHEPICVARKPLVGTVAANVLVHGTGALNIDGCRVGLAGGTAKGSKPQGAGNGIYGAGLHGACEIVALDAGRWPANLIHDGSDEVVAAFPDAKGQQGRAHTDGEAQGNNTYGALNHVTKRPDPRGDTGSAARFFYCAKTSRKDRNEGLEDPGPQFKRGSTLRQIENVATNGNNHPTVKPTELMKYLCRLVTPPNGTILDPFMGSGSTGKAAIMEGFNFIGCELDEEYYNIAKKRIEFALEKLHINTLDDLI